MGAPFIVRCTSILQVEALRAQLSLPLLPAAPCLLPRQRHQVPQLLLEQVSSPLLITSNQLLTILEAAII